MSASSVNEATLATEKLRCDRLDAFFKLLQISHEAHGVSMFGVHVWFCNAQGFVCVRMFLTCGRLTSTAPIGGYRFERVTGTLQSSHGSLMMSAWQWHSITLCLLEQSPVYTTGIELASHELSVWSVCCTLVACSGALLATIARRYLHLPVLRYVDDFFSVSRRGTAERAMWVFARCRV